MRALATPFGGSEAALLVAAYLVALAAFLGALVLLHRLVSLELGRPLARPTLLLLAVFPAAVFFGAPYAESLFLLLAVGAFWTARTGRWAWAGACLAGAAATRSAGHPAARAAGDALVERARGARRASSPGWRSARSGWRAYALFLGLAEGDALRFLDVQEAWSRELDRAARRGLGRRRGGLGRAAPARSRARRRSSTSRRRPATRTGSPRSTCMLFGTLVFAVAACVGALRRLPAAYGAWVAVSLVLPLTLPGASRSR